MEEFEQPNSCLLKLPHAKKGITKRRKKKRNIRKVGPQKLHSSTFIFSIQFRDVVEQLGGGGRPELTGAAMSEEIGKSPGMKRSHYLFHHLLVLYFSLSLKRSCAASGFPCVTGGQRQERYVRD